VNSLARFAIGFLVLALPQVSKAACVQARVANLYKSPRSSAAKSWEAVIYTPLRLAKNKSKNKDWARVFDLDGKAHWIETKDLTTHFSCATVNVKSSQLFQKTNEAYVPIVNLPLVRTVSFKIVSEEAEWLNLEDALGNTYWGKKSDFWRPDAKPEGKSKH